jgi:uncharacterized membrane protein YphA (DoxX/SURF4 family)
MKWIKTIIRMAIGWHFLYEGAIKLFAEQWSAEAFLSNTFGFLSGFYHWLTVSPVRMEIVDFLNIWGLILIGLSLFFGLWSKWASIFGALLITLYYFSYPPFGVSLLSSDGTVFIINALFIEGTVLIFLFFAKEQGFGFDDLLQLYRKTKKNTASASEEQTKRDNPSENVSTRREALKSLVSLPVFSLLGWGAIRSSKMYNIDSMSGATMQFNRMMLSELKGELPKGKIGNQEISRLVLGGNLISGWSHSRDLLYTNSLFKAYNTEKKIFETLMLCEQAGINCINIGSWKEIAKYRKVTGSKMKVIMQASINERARDGDIYRSIKQSIDNGVDIIQLFGQQCDWFVRDNKLDLIDGFLSQVRSNGIVAGLGAHSIDSLLICEENGIIPDYYMKTMHHDDYWSAHPRENRRPFEVDGPRSNDHNMFHDNCFDSFPDRTVEFVSRIKVPVMGFKVLAAGAIHPKDGFKWTFENGADFLCVGMFDFQVVDDVNICIDTLNSLENRTRAWYS